MSDPLYHRDGDAFVPSEHTRGPWTEDAQHGGAPAALLVRALEALPMQAPGVLVRCTVDLLRPVPLVPLLVVAEVERPGRRVELLRAAITDTAGRELCVARAWRIRAATLDVPMAAPEPPPFAGPDASAPHERESDRPAFHRTGVEMRFARGSFWETGPCSVWIRLRRPVVDGEVPTPLQRTIAAADFGNGVSSALPWGDYVYINTDLSVSLHRSPEGEWIALDAATAIDPRGSGVAQSSLYDTRGRVGTSLQTLFVDAMPARDPGAPPP